MNIFGAFSSDLDFSYDCTVRPRLGGEGLWTGLDAGYSMTKDQQDRYQCGKVRNGENSVTWTEKEQTLSEEFLGSEMDSSFPGLLSVRFRSWLR